VGHANRLASLAHLLENRRALNPKFRKADFFHSDYILTMKEKLCNVTKEQSRREDNYEVALRGAAYAHTVSEDREGRACLARLS
jgi:hypothetical protein